MVVVVVVVAVVRAFSGVLGGGRPVEVAADDLGLGLLRDGQRGQVASRVHPGAVRGGGGGGRHGPHSGMHACTRTAATRRRTLGGITG